MIKKIPGAPPTKLTSGSTQPSKKTPHPLDAKEHSAINKPVSSTDHTSDYGAVHEGEHSNPDRGLLKDNFSVISKDQPVPNAQPITPPATSIPSQQTEGRAEADSTLDTPQATGSEQPVISSPPDPAIDKESVLLQSTTSPSATTYVVTGTTNESASSLAANQISSTQTPTAESLSISFEPENSGIPPASGTESPPTPVEPENPVTPPTISPSPEFISFILPNIKVHAVGKAIPMNIDAALFKYVKEGNITSITISAPPGVEAQLFVTDRTSIAVPTNSDGSWTIQVNKFGHFPVVSVSSPIMQPDFRLNFKANGSLPNSGSDQSIPLTILGSVAVHVAEPFQESTLSTHVSNNTESVNFTLPVVTTHAGGKSVEVGFNSILAHYDEINHIQSITLTSQTALSDVKLIAENTSIPPTLTPEGLSWIVHADTSGYFPNLTVSAANPQDFTFSFSANGVTSDGNSLVISGTVPVHFGPLSVESVSLALPNVFSYVGTRVPLNLNALTEFVTHDQVTQVTLSGIPNQVSILWNGSPIPLTMGSDGKMTSTLSLTEVSHLQNLEIQSTVPLSATSLHVSATGLSAATDHALALSGEIPLNILAPPSLQPPSVIPLTLPDVTAYAGVITSSVINIFSPLGSNSRYVASANISGAPADVKLLVNSTFKAPNADGSWTVATSQLSKLQIFSFVEQDISLKVSALGQMPGGIPLIMTGNMAVHVQPPLPETATFTLSPLSTYSNSQPIAIPLKSALVDALNIEQVQTVTLTAPVSDAHLYLADSAGHLTVIPRENNSWTVNTSDLSRLYFSSTTTQNLKLTLSATGIDPVSQEPTVINAFMTISVGSPLFETVNFTMPTVVAPANGGLPILDFNSIMANYAQDNVKFSVSLSGVTEDPTQSNQHLTVSIKGSGTTVDGTPIAISGTIPVYLAPHVAAAPPIQISMTLLPVTAYSNGPPVAIDLQSALASYVATNQIQTVTLTAVPIDSQSSAPTDINLYLADRSGNQALISPQEGMWTVEANSLPVLYFNSMTQQNFIFKVKATGEIPTTQEPLEIIGMIPVYVTESPVLILSTMMMTAPLGNDVAMNIQSVLANYVNLADVIVTFSDVPDFISLKGAEQVSSQADLWSVRASDLSTVQLNSNELGDVTLHIYVSEVTTGKITTRGEVVIHTILPSLTQESVKAVLPEVDGFANTPIDLHLETTFDYLAYEDHVSHLYITVPQDFQDATIAGAGVNVHQEGTRWTLTSETSPYLTANDLNNVTITPNQIGEIDLKITGTGYDSEDHIINLDSSLHVHVDSVLINIITTSPDTVEDMLNLSGSVSSTSSNEMLNATLVDSSIVDSAPLVEPVDTTYSNGWVTATDLAVTETSTSTSTQPADAMTDPSATVPGTETGLPAVLTGTEEYKPPL